jgi:gamma-glutamyltranspeptidase / glutathione hydrolase
MPRGMICAAQPESTEAGALVMRAGGNAVDGAIACALVAGVVDPMMTGIAGFGSGQFYLPGQGVHECIDFHGKTPAAARADMWADRLEGETRDGFGFVLKGRVNDLGYQSITVPGSLRAFHEAQTAYGVLPWAQVVQPAIDWAERGWLVKPHVAYFFGLEEQMGRVATVERLRFTPSGRALYCRPDGSPKRVGETVRNPEMAATLRRIAAGGADVFYTGELAERIAEDMRRHGGLLSYEDLRSYRTTHRAPLRGAFRHWSLATNHPPGGGLMLLQMLNILEQFDLQALGHNSVAYIRTVAEAMKQAVADKEAHVGDPAFVDVPVERLLSKAYARETAAAIRAGRRLRIDRVGLPEPKNTTHLAVIDGDGNAVTMTHTLGMPSGVITDGLGFMYNGAMSVFDPRPGRAGSVAPGKSRFSAICPTLVFDERGLRAAIGAPGGAQIAIGVMQALVNLLDFGMSMSDAVAAPRFSATSHIIDVTMRIPTHVTDELERDGYTVARNANTFDVAAVHGVEVRPDGTLHGGADPGHDGMAMAV